MNLTLTQKIAITMVVLGVLTTASAQLTDIFGPNVAKDIVSVAGLLNSTLSGIIAVLTGQSSQIKSVLAMPGVDHITVNAEANSTLATIAVDPSQAKIQPTPAALQQVAETAKGA